MSADLWILALGNALVAAALLLASFAKVVSPAILGRSLMLLTNRESLSKAAFVRTVGIVEAAVAAGLMLPASRVIASRALGLLGLVFIVAGILGKIRHVKEPCGCFGAISDKPFGWSNVLFGMLFVLACITNGVVQLHSMHTYLTAVPVTSGILICTICLITGTGMLRSGQTNARA
jgi:hypothetical protein